MDIGLGREGLGAPATVLSADFHGSDTDVLVAPDGELLPLQVTARAAGNLGFAPGTAVRISAHGTVCAWPAAERESGCPIPEAATKDDPD